jgi:guanine deaminase
MCLASALWARVQTVYFAADRHDAASAGFDDAEFYDFFAADPADRSMQVVHERTATATAPFDAWRALESRVEY